MRFYIILTLSLLSFTAFSQTGTIKGNVKDATNGEGIVGANVFVAGTTQGAAADINGDFEIPRVKAGKYSIVASFVSYKTDTILNVTVYPDQTTVLSINMREDVTELESVVVSVRKLTSTDVAVITELKKTDLVAVGISSQMIQMSQDRDAAQVIRRVPGVTITGNRFINVRGLSERYSTVMLNGIIAPSTEVDSKAFAFDLIPSNLIDRMLVYKSGAADLPGEFAGADINIFTKSVVEENATSLSVSGSFRPNSTGKDFILSQEKGKTDFLGFEDGTRALPATFPSQNLRSFSQNANDLNTAKLISATKSLPNNWGTRNFTAAPDLRVGLNFARSISLGKRKLDNITALSYTSTKQVLEIEQSYYEAFDPTTQKSGQRYKYNDTRFIQTNRIGAISNFTFEISPLHRIEFRNFYNQQGQNQATLREGVENAQGSDVRNQAFNYYSRGIYSGQLSGKHSFTDNIAFNWIFGYNNTKADQPDYRRIRSQRATGTNDPYAIVIPPGASAFEAGRFYSKLNENTLTAAGTVEYKLNPEREEDRQIKLIAGYYLEDKKRTFDARWMSYKWSSPSAVDLSMLLLPFNQVFAAQNLGNKFILEEGTNEGPNLYDRYDGYNQLAAGHIGIATPLGQSFRLSAGLRVEYNSQQIDVYDASRQKIQKVNSPLTVPMPFLNLSYNFSDEMLVRVAYSKTVNRPVFRELAPFNFYDFDRNADVYGNEALKTAKIDNIDLRWELYPSKGESISVGVFYKHFTDPIEQYLSQASNLIYSFTNAKQATNYGAEVEVRKSFAAWSSNSILKNLTLVLNGALINSTIEMPAELDNLEQNRAMQGQSPYIFNTSLFYNNVERGLQISAMYNIVGPRIYAVGDNNGNATQYEMPRNVVDLTINKQVGSHLQLKFGISDILNQKYRLVQDSNRDKKITSVDENIQTYRPWQYTTLGLSWMF
jgi:TonB-dependent receptor